MNHVFTPDPMAEVFFKDLNIWMCVCSYLKVIPLCNAKLYGMNTFKLSDTTSIIEGGNQNPHDSISSGSWCRGQLFYSVGFLFFLLSDAEITNHSHMQVHSHTWTNCSSGCLCVFHVHLFTNICSQHVHPPSCGLYSFSESTSQGSCLICVVHLFIHPSILTFVCSVEP